MRGDKSYTPSSASVSVRQQVAWHNADSIAHTATQDGGGFDTGRISPGATSAPVPINRTGTLSYHCTVHPSMVGEIRVKP